MSNEELNNSTITIVTLSSNDPILNKFPGIKYMLAHSDIDICDVRIYMNKTTGELIKAMASTDEITVVERFPLEGEHFKTRVDFYDNNELRSSNNSLSAYSSLITDYLVDKK